jgi:DNA-binding MarR family transcriptional regulator
MAKYLDTPFDDPSDATRFIVAAGRALEVLGRRSFTPYGLTISDVAPLVRLVLVGPATPSELLHSTILLTSPPVVTHSINRLEAADLVERRANAEDGRSVVVAATDAGREVAAELVDVIHDFSEGFLRPLSEDEVVLLRDMLVRCMAAAEG